MASELSFPFVSVTPVEQSFGGIPNYEEAAKACPQAFHQSNCWSRAAAHIFDQGLSPEEASVLQFKTDDEELAKAQVAYFYTWLRSYRPKHEVKMAVCGWLLSLIVETCPEW